MQENVARGAVAAGVGYVGEARRRLVRVLMVTFLALAGMTMGAEEAEAQYAPYDAADIPPVYLQEYQQAGAAYGVDWTILAAIGKVESNHGAGGTYGCILGPPTPYGPAYGPMQFLVSSWSTTGVDGNLDGIVDSCDPQDAIPSTANYLVKSGAPGDYYSAIYAYNHADWYVQSVLAQARIYYQVYVTGVY